MHERAFLRAAFFSTITAVLVYWAGAQETKECPKQGYAMDIDYAKVLDGNASTHLSLDQLPGFSRSVYERDHALVAPESRVWATLPGWTNALIAHLISPSMGAHFSMFLAELQTDASIEALGVGVERFILVLNGTVEFHGIPNHSDLREGQYAYLPPGDESRMSSSNGAGLLVYERAYKAKGVPTFVSGDIENSPILPCPPEVFILRKLLPTIPAYDFNIHIMDFMPGQYLYVKEMHYNQHGLLILQGQGIYKLNLNWYSVKTGDVIWMAPYVPQWYAALGEDSTRYILYKDTSLDPILY